MLPVRAIFGTPDFSTADFVPGAAAEMALEDEHILKVLVVGVAEPPSDHVRPGDSVWAAPDLGSLVGVVLGGCRCVDVSLKFGQAVDVIVVGRIPKGIFNNLFPIVLAAGDGRARFCPPYTSAVGVIGLHPQIELTFVYRNFESVFAGVTIP